MVGILSSCMGTVEPFPPVVPPVFRYAYNLYFDFVDGEEIEIVVDGDPVSFTWDGVLGGMTFTPDSNKIRAVLKIVTRDPITELTVVQGILDMQAYELPRTLQLLVLESGESILQGAWTDLPPVLIWLDVAGNKGVTLSGSSTDLPAGLVHLDIANSGVGLSGLWAGLPRQLEYLSFGGVAGFSLTGQTSGLPPNLIYFDAAPAAGGWQLSGPIESLPSGLLHFNVYNARGRVTITGSLSFFNDVPYFDIGNTQAVITDFCSWAPTVAIEYVGITNVQGLNNATLSCILDAAAVADWVEDGVLDVRTISGVLSIENYDKIQALIAGGLNVLFAAPSVPTITVTGGVVTEFSRDDVDYIQIRFDNDGAFTIEAGDITTVAVDVAVVGGGGTGGGTNGGGTRSGGGAGGRVREFLQLELTAGEYTYINGLGATVDDSTGSGNNRQGGVGHPSTLSGPFGSIVSEGGGGGGGNYGTRKDATTEGYNGGGAGGGNDPASSGIPGPGQGGYPGGAHQFPTDGNTGAGWGGGGAGAGGPGEDGSEANNKGGDGGPGVEISFMNPVTRVAGGGGGFPSGRGQDGGGNVTQVGTLGGGSGARQGSVYPGGNGLAVLVMRADLVNVV